ncbi:hypothetical protein BJ170DRAFT_646365 [Xylariales sp. AK1849]|nr:hypothetical protein BJ170DRAFT_646365 [Xylariales sp. AK1849]
MGFFANVPHTASAVFSTDNGRRPRRYATDFGQERRIHPWTAAQIQSAVDSIKVNCWELRKLIQKPTSYFELYHYWDGYDLWHMGVQNAWNVLNHMYWETQKEMPGILAEVRAILEEWVGNLVGDPICRQKLFYWNSAKGQAKDPLEVFEGVELIGMQNVDTFYLPLIREVLYETSIALKHGNYVAHTPISTLGAPGLGFDIHKTNGGDSQKSTGKLREILSVLTFAFVSS